MDIIKNNLVCEQHNRVCEAICYQCHGLMCSRCLTIHSNKYQNSTEILHHCEHIDDIKLALANINNSRDGKTDRVQDDDYNAKFIQSKLDTIWTTIKECSSHYQSLESTEQEISSHFNKLHEYLVIEEHRVKKPIATDKESIKKSIESNINELKHLVAIINLHNNNDKENDNNELIDAAASATAASNTTIDTIDKYGFTTILESAQQSRNLISFISKNNEALFSNFSNRFYNITQYSHPDLFILDLIFKYNNQFNNNTLNSNQAIEFNQYQLVMNKQVNSTKELFSNSIKLQCLKQNSSFKQSYILSTHQNNGVTLIDISNNMATESIECEYDFTNTYNSMVTVGDHIYIFGGWAIHRNNYLRFSIRSKSFDLLGDIVDIDDGNCISACYDGQDHIYLINGSDRNNSIDRFNIKSRTFEKYHHLPKDGHQIISFCYGGLIYSLPHDEPKIFIFDPATKEVLQYESTDLFSRTKSACTDGDGNIYILSNDSRFIKLNVVDKKITELKSIGVVENIVPMVYYKQNENERYIYLFGEKNSNLKYSLERNEWRPFFESDRSNRVLCGSSIITIC